jgi:hypothetical protein
MNKEICSEDNSFMITEIQNSVKNKRKGRKRLKESYKEKFLVKKVKTRCFKIFFKLLNTCIHLNVTRSKWKINEKKEVFKLFKNDVCKSRNRLILKVSMKNLITIFSNINMNEITIREDKKNKFKYLMNIHWEDFLNHINRGGKEFREDVWQDEVSSSEIIEYFKYINSVTKYKERKIDQTYSNLYRQLVIKSKDEIDDEKSIVNNILLKSDAF